MGAIFTLRWKAPLMALGGPSIDRYAQALPIPARAMVTGMLGAALGLRRAEAERLQLLHDTLRHAAVVHRPGTPLEDYQTADLSQAHLRGPMWWLDTRGRFEVIERQGGDTEGIRPLHRPYLADADMTVLVELLAGSPYAAEALLAALERPVFPLYLGRASCPPAGPVAGRILNAQTLVDAVRQIEPGTAYLPVEVSERAWGDLIVSLPAGRDWRTRRHGGSALFIVRSNR